MALQAEISGDFYILESLPYWVWALGCQASHATAFVFCFYSWAGGMSLLFTSIWRLQTQVKKGKRKEGRKRNRQRRMSFSVSTPHCISSLRGPGSLLEDRQPSSLRTEESGRTRCESLPRHLIALWYCTRSFTPSSPISPPLKWCLLPASPTGLP